MASLNSKFFILFMFKRYRSKQSSWCINIWTLFECFRCTFSTENGKFLRKLFSYSLCLQGSAAGNSGSDINSLLARNGVAVNLGAKKGGRDGENKPYKSNFGFTAMQIWIDNRNLPSTLISLKRWDQTWIKLTNKSVFKKGLLWWI